MSNLSYEEGTIEDSLNKIIVKSLEITMIDQMDDDELIDYLNMDLKDQFEYLMNKAEE